MHVESKLRKPLITGGKTLNDVSEDICKRVEQKTDDVVETWRCGSDRNGCSDIQQLGVVRVRVRPVVLLAR